MKQIIDGVYELLLEQKAVQETLLDLARKKRDAVVKNDTDELSLIVADEYVALSNMKKIEKQRTKLSNEAAALAGKSPEDMTVTELVELAEESQKAKLEAVRSELMDIIGKLKSQNDENRSLVEMQLEFNSILMSAVGGSEDPLNNFYGDDGQSLDVEISRGTSILDTEI